MTNKIMINRLPKDDDDHIIFEIDGQTVEAMIGICPYEIKEGQIYNVEITFYIKDSFEIALSGKIDKSLKYLKNYEYIINGKLLDNERIDVGFLITSEWFHLYQHYVGEYVTCKIDRLEVNFN